MVKKEAEELKEEIKEGSTIVVSEIPKVDARIFTDDEGNQHPLITKDEALTEILEIVKRLEKVWGK